MTNREREILRNLNIQHTKRDKDFTLRSKTTKRPGLQNDAVFKDSASSLDVCI